MRRLIGSSATFLSSGRASAGAHGAACLPQPARDQRTPGGVRAIAGQLPVRIARGAVGIRRRIGMPRDRHAVVDIVECRPDLGEDCGGIVFGLRATRREHRALQRIDDLDAQALVGDRDPDLVATRATTGFVQSPRSASPSGVRALRIDDAGECGGRAGRHRLRFRVDRRRRVGHVAAAPWTTLGRGACASCPPDSSVDSGALK